LLFVQPEGDKGIDNQRPVARSPVSILRLANRSIVTSIYASLRHLAMPTRKVQ
jgi:hypothetical protein